MRRTEGEWARIVARKGGSGLSMRRFAANEGVSEQSLRSWAKKLDGVNPQSTRSGGGFVEIGEGSGQRQPEGTRGGMPAPCGLVIRLASGVNIEAGPGTDRELLGWVLDQLGRAP